VSYSIPTAPGRASEPVIRHVPTAWTRPLQWLTALCALVFTIGTALQTFVFVDEGLIARSMQLSGMSASAAAEAAPGFLTMWRMVGVAYIIGNANGLLAPQGDAKIFWVVLLVNASQAAGIFVISPTVITAMQELNGGAAYITTLIVDGGALILTAIMLLSLLRFRSPWAYARTATTSES
jgi:hypothetical protein